MHRIEVDEWRVLGEDSVRKFRSNSPAGGWFPALQVLHWTIAESNLHYADLFLSRHLTDIFISPSSFWFKAGIPHDVLPAVASTIYTFPTSALRSLRIHSMKPQEGLHGPLSSVVLRCGPSLTKFDSMIPLSDAATTHLFRLPHLHTWRTKGPPPDFPPSSLPLVFPSLVELALCDRSACGWLSLLERSEQTVPTTQGSSGVRESLRSLIIRIPPAGIDGSLLSKIRILRNLVYLSIQFCCSNGRCGFKLNNDDVAKLAMELPQIETLVLGYTCGENTCATTVACFLPISACCVKLQYLRIHFSTTNIIDDLKNVFEDPRFQELSSLPRCALTRLDADHVPLSFEEAGLETVARGLVDLFPSLERCLGYGSWGKISEIIGKLRGALLISCNLTYPLHLTYFTGTQMNRRIANDLHSLLPVDPRADLTVCGISPQIPRLDGVFVTHPQTRSHPETRAGQTIVEDNDTMTCSEIREITKDLHVGETLILSNRTTYLAIYTAIEP